MNRVVGVYTGKLL